MSTVPDFEVPTHCHCNPNAHLHVGSDANLQRVRKALYICVAGICVLLGVIGIVLPGLPTTPFLLLASGLLAKSSPRLNHMLLTNKTIGPILQQWQQERTIKPAVKTRAVVLVCAMLLLVVGLTDSSTELKIAISSMGAFGLLVIFYLPTSKARLASTK
ncbi:MAG: YbaN family protein [Planctomycetales bacterium]|nr:YbaN family protein [Planctomycetales bacterium]